MQTLKFRLFISLLIFICTILLLLYILAPASPRPRKREFIFKNFSPIATSLHPGRFKDVSINVSSIVDGKEVYNTNYVFDHNYNRKLEKTKNLKKKHFLIDGCSFAFGEGLEKSQSLDYIIQKNSPYFDVTNISVMGGSPHLSLYYHQKVNISSLSNNKKGYYFYFFILDQIFRWRLDFTYLDWADSGYPYFQISDNKLKYMGSLGDAPSYKIHHALKKIKINPQVLNLKARIKISEMDIENFVLAIKELEKSYLKSYPEGKFYFVFHPLAAADIELMINLEKTLKYHKINSMNPVYDFLSKLSAEEKPYDDYTIPNDGHPNEKLNMWLVNWILKNEKIRF